MPTWLPKALVAIVLGAVILLIAQRFMHCASEGLCIVGCAGKDRTCFATEAGTYYPSPGVQKP